MESRNIHLAQPCTRRIFLGNLEDLASFPINTASFLRSPERLPSSTMVYTRSRTRNRGDRDPCSLSAVGWSRQPISSGCCKAIARFFLRLSSRSRDTCRPVLGVLRTYRSSRGSIKYSASRTRPD